MMLVGEDPHKIDKHGVAVTWNIKQSNILDQGRTTQIGSRPHNLIKGAWRAVNGSKDIQTDMLEAPEGG